MSLALVDELVYCYCGCGEPTNTKHLLVRQLRAEGWTFAAIAQRPDFACSKRNIMQYAKAGAPVSVKGHSRPAIPTCDRLCLVCQRVFRAIGSKDCCDDRGCDTAQHRAGLFSTPGKQAECDEWYSRHADPLERPQGISRPERVLLARGHLMEYREAAAAHALPYIEARRVREDERATKRAVRTLVQWQNQARRATRRLEEAADNAAAAHARQTQLAQQREARLREKRAAEAAALETRKAARQERYAAAAREREARELAREAKRQERARQEAARREESARRREARRIVRAFAESRGLRSLDYATEKRIDHYASTFTPDEDVFSDPTFDAVCARLDAEAQESRRDVAEWNVDHRVQRERIDTTNFTQMPGAGNGLTHHMASRHRGRNAQRALMAGKRIARKPREKV